MDIALRDKIEDDASEMAAFMRQLMESYLVGPQYSGYDGVAFINSTTFQFNVVLPDPTGDIDVDSIESTASSNLEIEELAPLHRVYSEYIVISVVVIIVICCGVVAVLAICCRNQTKLKRQLTETQHQVTRLKSLSHFEGADDHNDHFGAEGAAHIAGTLCFDCVEMRSHDAMLSVFSVLVS